MNQKDRKNLNARLVNILTLSRIVFAIVTVLFLVLNKTYWAVSFLLLGYLTDKIDGTISRKLKIQSKIGNLLDSVTDRIFQIIIVSALLFLGKLPLFFIIYIGFWIIMELFLGILMTKRLGKFYLFANHRWSAKITSSLGCITFVSIILGLDIQVYFIYLLILSSIWYMVGHINLLIKHKEKSLLK